jgi:hypothetical protein
LEWRRSVPVLDRGDRAGDLVVIKGGNTSDRPVQLLDRRRLAGRSVALRQILTGQTSPSRTLPGQSEASQSHHQLRPGLERLLKVSPTSDSIFHLSLSEKPDGSNTKTSGSTSIKSKLKSETFSKHALTPQGVVR